MPKEPSTKGERSQQKILAAAYTLFIAQGFAATSMRQIAERAGLALGGIYNHFPSKEAIFENIILEHHPFRRIIPLLNQASGATVEEFVHNAAKKLIAELGAQPDFLNLMLIEMVEFKGQHAARLFGLVFPEAIAVGVRFQQFGGEVRAIPAPLLMRAFLGMFFSYYITDLLLGQSMPPEMNEGSLERFVEIFLHGIVKPKAGLETP